MMGPIDPTDPQNARIQKLLAALKAQGGGGKPLFGGGMHVAGGGGGPRGMANYYKPGFAGINYNPLAAQMAQGAPGLLGLNSGHDTNPSMPAPAPGGGAPADPGDGLPPPSQGNFADGTPIAAPPAGALRVDPVGTGDPNGTTTRPPWEGIYQDPNQQPYRRRGLWDPSY